MSRPAIAIQGVSKRFNTLQALDKVSLDIQEGEFFALLGPNGAGKTTLISILAGLSRMDSGHVHIMGHDVQRDYRQARRAIGIVPQELVFDPFFSVRETLAMQSGYFGLRKNDAWIDELLHKLGLTDKADTNMRALSGGMKRRVLVGQALVHKPAVIILDEPTAGVDVALRQTLWQFIRELNTQGHTIVLTTHYLEEAQTLCNRVAMLKNGRVIALEDTDTLLASKQTRQIRVRLALGAAHSAQLQSFAFLPDADQAGDGHLHGTVTLPDYAAIEPLMAHLRTQHITLHTMEILTPSLEDIFLDTMEHAA